MCNVGMMYYMQMGRGRYARHMWRCWLPRERWEAVHRHQRSREEETRDSHATHRGTVVGPETVAPSEQWFKV